MSRIISWFSCGAASACAAKLAITKYPKVEVIYCNTMASEHPDNQRFMREVSEWLGQPVQVIESQRYQSVDDVFMQRRYMAGPKGAVCTVEMKKVPRFEYQEPDDVHIFGYTAEETKRIVQFENNNPELKLDWILWSNGYTKRRCYRELVMAGIEIPKMYQLGYRNNNCIGCVKATSPAYWNMVREDFPETFAKRATQSRELGVRLARLKGKRVFLDELPVDATGGELENVSCGPECGTP